MRFLMLPLGIFILLFKLDKQFWITKPQKTIPDKLLSVLTAMR